MTTPHDDQADELNRLRGRRAARRAQVLAELLERRPDLWGVHSPADLAADSASWAVQTGRAPPGLGGVVSGTGSP